AGATLAVRPAAYYGLGGPDVAASRRDAVEAVVADLAKGGGAALVCSGLLLAGAWWLRRAVCHGRPRAGRGVGDAGRPDPAVRETPQR
ncbi:hypothetical protein, partial [Streptomyces spiramenti]